MPNFNGPPKNTVSSSPVEKDLNSFNLKEGERLAGAVLKSDGTWDTSQAVVFSSPKGTNKEQATLASEEETREAIFKRKVLEVGGELERSTRDVERRQYLNRVKQNADYINSSQDWDATEASVTERNPSNKEREAISYALGVLRNLKASENTEELVQQAAGRIEDIAVAANFLGKYGKSEIPQWVKAAADKLFEAVVHYADSGAVKEATYQRAGGQGGALNTDEELARKREEISRMNIS